MEDLSLPPGTKLFLIVYVDKFKMGGLAHTIVDDWGSLRQAAAQAPPTDMGDLENASRLLGCDCAVYEKRLRGMVS